MRPCFRFAPDGRRAAVNALLSSGIKQHRFGQEGIELGPPTLDRGRNGRFEQVPRPSAGGGSSVQRIWRARSQTASGRDIEGLARQELRRRANGLVGLYPNPLDKALVLCVDDRNQIQALDRTQFGLHMKRAALNVFLEHAAQGRHRSTWVRRSRSDRDRSHPWWRRDLAPLTSGEL
jgi:hypothetical protein